ncbi:MAG: hypothetical protein L0Y72_14150 [Gemmataceae bacterium]|nr:hypothetical protein [Gemmataceae bacterium]MCI0740184.1 hypothetical protein [Gemmataceae bacterium]
MRAKGSLYAWEEKKPVAAPSWRQRQVLTIKPGQRWRIYFLADATGIYTHFVDGRSKPCKTHDCRHCTDPRTPRRFYAYAPALAWRWIKTGRQPQGDPRTQQKLEDKETGFWGRGTGFDQQNKPVNDTTPVSITLELPQGAYTSILDFGDLAGQCVELERVADRNNKSRIEAVSVPELLDSLPSPLPEPWDPRPILCRMWGVPEETSADRRPERDAFAGRVDDERRRRAIEE